MGQTSCDVPTFDDFSMPLRFNHTASEVVSQPNVMGSLNRIKVVPESPYEVKVKDCEKELIKEEFEKGKKMMTHMKK